MVAFSLRNGVSTRLTLVACDRSTFLKRKGGLFKKAHELSVLCSVDVAVIIFGHNKRLYEFSSGEIQDIISRHQYVCLLAMISDGQRHVENSWLMLSRLAVRSCTRAQGSRGLQRQEGL